jgi:hypothetical protein
MGGAAPSGTRDRWPLHHYRGITCDATGAVWLDGERFTDEAARSLAPFLVRRGPRGWETIFPKPVDVDACRTPRGDVRLAGAGQLLASGGTPRRPCLLRREGEGWSEVPLLAGSAKSLMDESARSRAEELMVLHLGQDEQRRSSLALRRADGWHLERAPMRNIVNAVLNPDAQRAWLVPESLTLLDFAAEEAWRFVTPTLVLGEAEPKVSVADRVARATPWATPLHRLRSDPRLLLLLRSQPQAVPDRRGAGGGSRRTDLDRRPLCVLLRAAAAPAARSAPRGGRAEGRLWQRFHVTERHKKPAESLDSGCPGIH